jgi:hypothetical protein
MQLVGMCLVKFQRRLWIRERDGSWHDVGPAHKRRIRDWQERTQLPLIVMNTSSQNGFPGARQVLRSRVAITGLGMAV